MLAHYAQHTGFARTLDALNADARRGAMVIQYDKHGGDNQKWALEKGPPEPTRSELDTAGKIPSVQWDVWGGVIWQQDRTDDPVQSCRYLNLATAVTRLEREKQL